MFAVIHLPQFALQAALRHELELWRKPVALVDTALNPPRVWDATDAARSAGVSEGLTPTQALARCRDVLIRHRSPAQEIAATEATLLSAYGFSPNIESTSPGTVTLDLCGLAEISEHPASGQGEKNLIADTRRYLALQRWASRLRSVLASLGLDARIGIGATPNIARHAAWWRGSGQAGPRQGAASGAVVESNSGRNDEHITVVTDSSAFVAGLPVAALEPSTDVATILQKWGIRTVGELLALGQPALTDRLGLEALALFAAASTTVLRPLHLVRPVERYEESFDFQHEAETMEPLLFILHRFVDYLSRRLELSGLVAACLTLRLRLESGEVMERRLRIPQPTRQADVLFRTLRTHLETLRTNSPIVAVALQADPTQPEQKQFSLFEVALRAPQQFQETLARLSALLGADRVGTPMRENSHRPDAFKLVPPDFENAPGAIVERVAEVWRTAPVRRFRPAVKATVATTGGDPAPCESRFPPAADPGPPIANKNLCPPEVPSPRPMSLCCSVANGQLKLILGPWRGSGNWWEPGRWQREEWDVATRDGKLLRLVQRPEGWFVEGLVD